MRVLILMILFMISSNAVAAADKFTTEEKVVMNYFANYVMSKTYDRVCNKPNLITNDISNPVSLNIMGHAQIMPARVAGLWLIKNPKATLDEGIKFLGDLEKSIDTAAENILIKEGCSSPNGLKGKESFLIFSKNSPDAIYHAIDKEIVAKGGTVTPFEKMNKPLPQK